MHAIPSSKFLHRHLDKPMRGCAAAHRHDLRTDLVVPKPGKYVDPHYVVDCADGDTVRVEDVSIYLGNRFCYTGGKGGLGK